MTLLDIINNDTINKGTIFQKPTQINNCELDGMKLYIYKDEYHGYDMYYHSADDFLGVNFVGEHICGTLWSHAMVGKELCVVLKTRAVEAKTPVYNNQNTVSLTSGPLYINQGIIGTSIQSIVNAFCIFEEYFETLPKIHKVSEDELGDVGQFKMCKTNICNYFKRCQKCKNNLKDYKENYELIVSDLIKLNKLFEKNKVIKQMF